MRNIIILFIAALLISCANNSQHRLDVSAYSQAPGATDKKTYLLLPGDENVKQEDLKFQEYSKHLALALDSQGFKAAQSEKDANVVIFLTYGVSVADSRQFPNTSLKLHKVTMGPSNSYGSVTPSNATSATYGSEGTSKRSKTTLTYIRYAQITGFDYQEFKNDNQKEQLWKTTVTSTGLIKDLDRIFPTLIEASTPYLGVGNEKTLDVLSTESNEVARID